MPMQTVPAVLTLVSDTDSIEIRPQTPHMSNPIICSSWDLGAPAVRESVVDRPGADGTVDRTTFAGSRTVTMDLHIWGDNAGTAYSYLERLAAMTHPGLRPRLVIRRDTADNLGIDWELELRGTPYSLAYGRSAAAKLDVQLSFVAPLGFLQTSLWRSVQSGQVSATATVGWKMPFTLPLSTGSTTSANYTVNLTVGGTVPIAPVLYIYGPVTNPELLDDAGNRFKFVGLTLDPNQFVQVDMGAATVRIGGSADANVYYLVDFSVSSFWTWRPGVHTVRYLASSGSLTVQWRERRYSI